MPATDTKHAWLTYASVIFETDTYHYLKKLTDQNNNSFTNLNMSACDKQK